MTQDNTLDAPDVRYDHANFRQHWIQLGAPVCELFDSEKGLWVGFSPGATIFFSDTRYRIKNDPNWELRERWLASGRKLQLELWGAEDHVWNSVTGMHRIGDVKYREKIVTDQSVEAVIAAKKKREFDRKHPDVVPTKRTLVTITFTVPAETNYERINKVLKNIYEPELNGNNITVSLS